MAKKKAKKGRPTNAAVATVTSADRSRLADLEAALTRCQSSFVEAGNALREIRDGLLYRADFATFEAYCQERWQFTPRYCLMLVRAAEVVEAIGTIVPIAPATETQARELSRIEKPEEQVAAWGRVVERAGGDAAKITAKIVKEEVAKVLPPVTPRGPRSTPAAPAQPTKPAAPPEEEEEAKPPAKAKGATKDDPENPPADPRFMPHAAEAAAFAEQFKTWMARLRAVRTELRKALPDRGHVMAERIDLGGFDAALTELVDTLDKNIPDRVCPVCVGTGAVDATACKFCDGYGIVDVHHHAGLKAKWKHTRARFDALSAESGKGAA